MEERAGGGKLGMVSGREIRIVVGLDSDGYEIEPK